MLRMADTMKKKEIDQPERKIAHAASVPVTVSVKSPISLSLSLRLVRSLSTIYFSTITPGFLNLIK